MGDGWVCAAGLLASLENRGKSNVATDEALLVRQRFGGGSGGGEHSSGAGLRQDVTVELAAAGRGVSVGVERGENHGAGEFAGWSEDKHLLLDGGRALAGVRQPAT